MEVIVKKKKDLVVDRPKSKSVGAKGPSFFFQRIEETKTTIDQQKKLIVGNEIWYNREKCDCPSQMKARACKRALKDKESFEKSKQSQNDK
jgi:hypothetical protein